jgi:hypothetical protein
MTQIRVIVVSPEEADKGSPRSGAATNLMAVTIPHEGQLYLRIDSRADGLPWLIETTSLARGLAEAVRQLTTYWPRRREISGISTTELIRPPQAPGADRPVVSQ